MINSVWNFEIILVINKMKKKDLCCMYMYECMKNMNE